MSELFDDMGIDPMLFFMMSGLFGGRRGGPFGGPMGMKVGGMGPFVFVSGRGGGGPRGAMYYAGLCCCDSSLPLGHGRVCWQPASWAQSAVAAYYIMQQNAQFDRVHCRLVIQLLVALPMQQNACSCIRVLQHSMQVCRCMLPCCSSKSRNPTLTCPVSLCSVLLCLVSAPDDDDDDWYDDGDDEWETDSDDEGMPGDRRTQRHAQHARSRIVPHTAGDTRAVSIVLCPFQPWGA